MATETFEAELDAAADAHPFPTPVAQQIVDEARAEFDQADAPAAGEGGGPPAGATLPPGFDPRLHAWPP